MKSLSVVLFAFALVACSSLQTAQPVEVTRVVEVTKLVEVTRQVEVTRIIEVTVPPPTEMPTPTVAASGDEYAHNCMGKFDSGGIEINVVRALVAKKAATGQDFSLAPVFENVDVVGMLILRITNTSDKQLSIYPDQGTILIGSEQVELRDYLLGGGIRGLDDVGGDIFPGISKLGGFWYGIRQMSLDQITTAQYLISAPVDDGFNRTGDDLNILLDWSDKAFEPLPEDLRTACP